MTTTEERAQDTQERLEKLQKKLPPMIIEELTALDTVALKARIVLAQANLAENEREKDADLDLLAAKNTYKNLGAPYKEAKTEQTSIATYCTLLLEQRGK